MTKGHHTLGNIVAATYEITKGHLMNLMTMRFMRGSLKFQVLLQQCRLVYGGLNTLTARLPRHSM